jgi:hypothetical protein
MKIEDIKKYESIKDSIYNRSKEICEYIITNDLSKSKDIGNRWSVDSFEIDEKEVDVRIYEYWGYGGYDYHTIRIDLNLFTSDDWLSLITEKTIESNKEYTRIQSEKEEKERLYKIEQAKKVLEELENKKN